MTIRPDPMPAIQAAATVRLGNTTGLRDAPAWLLDAVESYPRTRTQCWGPGVRAGDRHDGDREGPGQWAGRHRPGADEPGSHRSALTLSSVDPQHPLAPEKLQPAESTNLVLQLQPTRRASHCPGRVRSSSYRIAAVASDGEQPEGSHRGLEKRIRRLRLRGIT